MEKLCRRRKNVRAAIAKVVATIRALLQDTGTPTVEIRKQLRLVNGNYVEMKALDKCIWEDLDDDEFDADLAASYEFDAEVVEIRMHADFCRPSAALSYVAAKDPRAPNPDFAVIRHGKTTALSGESKMAAEAQNVANVHPVCRPGFCELLVLTAGEDSARTSQVEDSASDPLEDPLGAPSSPPCDDCVVFAEGQNTELTKDGVNTTHDDAVDPGPSLTCTDGPGVATTRERSVPREHVDGRGELAP